MTSSGHGSEQKSLEAFRIAGLPPDFYYIPNFISVEEETSILQKVCSAPTLAFIICSLQHISETLHYPAIPSLSPHPTPFCSSQLTAPTIPASRWTHLTHRRLQAIPSTLTKNNTLLAAPLPTYLVHPILPRFEELGIFDKTPHGQPNHVLINEYQPGEGIMPHEDGDAYASVVATVSLGGALCLDIVPKSGSQEGEEEENKWKVPTRIFQEPRSLLVTMGAAYRELMHGISAIEVDENLREETVVNWELLGDKEVVEGEKGRNVRSTRVSLTYRDVLKVSSAASKVFGGLSRH